MELGWARIRIPAQFAGGADTLRSRAKWQLRQVRGDIWAVCTEESYKKVPFNPVRAELIVRATGAAVNTAYDPLTRLPLQTPASDSVWNQVAPEVGKLIDRLPDTLSVHDQVDFWDAYGLVLTVCPTPIVAMEAQKMFNLIAKGLPEASMWLIRVDDRVFSRQAAIRALFATDHAPELLARTPEELLNGFPAARGLSSPDGLGAKNLWTSALMVQAPWLLGTGTARYGGGVATLFGTALAGRRASANAEPIQRDRPHFLETPTPSTEARPQVSPAKVESFLTWWVDRVGRLMALVLDPVQFVNDSREHDAAAQLGLLLSLDRLFACLQGVLYGSRRDDFTRMVLMFDAVDLLEGMGLDGGKREKLISHKRLSTAIEELSEQLPPAVAELVLPRCSTAVAALKAVESGFYLRERINDEGLIAVTNKRGGTDHLAMDRAVAQYLGVVRNSTHSFAQTVETNPHALSLLAAHDGQLDAAMADIVLLHVVRILHHPLLVMPRQFRTAAKP